jgi:hypothetical protein
VRASFILPAAILLAIAAPTSATTYSVCPDGSGDFETIQDGIDAAVDGDVVELCDAVFSGTGNGNCDFLGKAITVRSASGEPEQCVVVPFGGAAFYFASGEGPSSVLEGITIRGGSSPFFGGGIVCYESSPTIDNCMIVENEALSGGGIRIVFGTPVFRGCTINANTAPGDWHGSGYGGGVLCELTDARFESCLITGNWTNGVAGGCCILGGSMQFINCTISGNQGADGGGLYVYYPTTAALENCILWGNCASGSGDEAFLEQASTVLALTCSDVDSSGISGPGAVQYLSGNLFVNPLFCDPADCSAAPTTAGDYRLAANSPCLDAPGCGLVGALEQGCGPIPVEASSWGWIKSLYR